LSNHVGHYKSYMDGKFHNLTSFEIIKTGDYKITLVELFPCNSSDELTAREGHYIRNFDCVNRCIAGRTQNQWYDDNKDRILDDRKEYYNTNKESILQVRGKYREENREAINVKQNEKVQCECGAVISRCGKSVHKKTKKHQKWVELQEE